jgi:hypothetical protein
MWFWKFGIHTAYRASVSSETAFENQQATWGTILCRSGLQTFISGHTGVIHYQHV